MEVFIKENLKMAKKMERGELLGLITRIMKEILLIIIMKDMELI